MSTLPVYHKDVLEFITVAKEYILFLDNFKEEKKKVFVFKVQKFLTLLYLKASLIPEVENISNEGNERFCTEELYEAIKEKIHKQLRTNDNEILLNYDSQNIDEQEVVCVSEILADIYQSLFDFLNLYRIGTEKMMNDAIWECQQDFKNLWGKKLIAVLNIFHQLLYEDLINENDFDTETKSKDKKTKKNNWFTNMMKENE